MKNGFFPRTVKIKSVIEQSIDSKLFKLVFEKSADQKNFNFFNGQFVMIGVPGEGEGAFNICSDPADSKKYLEISVRKIGRLTEVIHNLKAGQTMQIRGPFGRGWPDLNNLKTSAQGGSASGGKLLLVGGGCGFVPLRSVILEILNKKNKLNNLRTSVFYGCANYQTLLFKDEIPEWEKKLNLKVIFDKEKKNTTVNNIKFHTGLITKLFDLCPISSDTIAFLCGPAVMFKFVIGKLKKIGLCEENIYLSLERRMECGGGICQHCASGDKYVCKDGPVFRYDEIKGTELLN